MVRFDVHCSLFHPQALDLDFVPVGHLHHYLACLPQYLPLAYCNEDVVVVVDAESNKQDTHEQ